MKSALFGHNFLDITFYDCSQTPGFPPNSLIAQGNATALHRAMQQHTKLRISRIRVFILMDLLPLRPMVFIPLANLYVEAPKLAFWASAG